MQSDKNFIKCPTCGAEINVNEVLYHQLQDQVKREFEIKHLRKEKELEKKDQELSKKEEEINNERTKLKELVDQQVKDQLKVEKTKILKQVKNQVDEENAEKIELLQIELQEKSEKVKELKKKEAEIERLKREKGELKEQIEAEFEKKMNEQLEKEIYKVKTNEKEKSQTELQKRDKVIESLKTQLEEAQRKIEQGSIQIQGEVKEVELRDFLKLSFPQDEIKDVPVGVPGGDCIQVIKNTIGKESGIILYERKQTKNWDEKWISKLKEDGRAAKADICVIVSKTMPKDCEATHFRDGVWVCNTMDVKLISSLLRDGLIKQYNVLASQTDKGTKMEMLYNYLTSNEFRNHVLGILEAFKSMDKALMKEKEESIKKFAERETHIFKAKQSLLNFWGRVDGIAGESLKEEIKILESDTKKLPHEE